MPHSFHTLHTFTFYHACAPIASPGTKIFPAGFSAKWGTVAVPLHSARP